jgi:hypothetical protein
MDSCARKCQPLVLMETFLVVQTNTNHSSLRTVRMAELYGGILSSSLSREHITFTAEFLRGEEYVFYTKPRPKAILNSPQETLCRGPCR